MRAAAVKKTISLPADLARELESQARDQRKSFSGVVQDALWAARRRHLETEFHRAQHFWARRAREKGILSPRDLERLLNL